MSAADVVLLVVGIIAYGLITLACITFMAGAERRRRNEDVTRACSTADDAGGYP